jgi:MscS family membrane protein
MMSQSALRNPWQARLPMPSLAKTVMLSLLGLAIAWATPPEGRAQTLPSSPGTTTGESAPTDPLGRTTPSSAVLGFLKAAQAGDYNIAAQYLQISAARRQAEGEQTATKLKFLLDHAFSGSLSRYNQAEGIPQDGVPLGRQRLGTISAGDVEADLDLVRVNDPSAGKIWLISSETLAKVPELYDQVEARQVESKLPGFVVKHQLLGMPLWQWVAMLLSAPAAAGLGWLILALFEIPLRWWARRRGRLDVASWRSVSGPAWLMAGTLIHKIFVTYLRLPLLDRHYYLQVSSILLILSATWIGWRFARWSLDRMRVRALARGHAGTGSLMLLGERILKVFIFLLGALAVLGNLGFNLSALLAGLGIGGLAIGFGAQKTIENLFGGVSVLGDEVFRVGDVCRFGDRMGTVEDIGLRSTRIRTDERTLVAIPNGTVATINLENLSRRDKIQFKTNLGLRADSKADHVRFVIAEIRKLLYGHPKIETQTVRVRFTEIAGSSLNVEVLAYVLTREVNEFMAVREDLLLRILEVMEDSGGRFALPSQTLYLSRDSGAEEEKIESAVKKISELRDGKKLPFPDFHPDEISSLNGSIEYPPQDSTLRNPRDESGKSRS